MTSLETVKDYRKAIRHRRRLTIEVASTFGGTRVAGKSHGPQRPQH